MHRPSPLRLLWLFARTAVRRFGNRYVFLKQKKAEAKRKKLGLPEPERTATAHRQTGFRAGSILAWLFMAYMMFAFTMMMNTSYQRAMYGVLKERQPAGEEESAIRHRGSDPIGGNALVHMNFETRRTADKVTALIMFTAGVGTLLFAIGILSRQVSRPEPSLAWLFEFPVPRPVLFTSKLSECLFDGASLPLLSMLPGIVLFHSGWSFWKSAGWGLAFGVIIALAVAALRIAVEVLLLQKCPRRRRGTIGGFCAAGGTLLMVIVLYGGGTPSLLHVLLAMADALPDWLFWNPFSAGFGLSQTVLGVQWLTAAGVTGLLCTGSVFFCSRITQFGLEPGLETARGATPVTASTKARPRFSGLVGKELLMLVRQRTVMVQVLLAPVIMVLMMYFQTSGKIAESTLGSAGAIASAIYGICAYMVLIASQVAMNTELRTLWLLLSLPRPLADSLRVKSRIWGAAAAALAFVLAVIAMIVMPDMAAGVLYRLPFLVILIAVIADICVGFRTMGSSIISETTVHLRQWAVWLPLMLSAAAGQAVFSGDVWLLCVQLVLIGSLDVSVWQKLKAELPFLTEPAEDPPPRLYLMHGLLAAYGYFALQGLGFLIAAAAKVPPAAFLPVASGIAAAIVAALTFWLLSRKKVRILPAESAPAAQSLLLAAAGLAAACAIGFLWLSALEWMPFTAEAIRQSRAALQSTSSIGEWIGLAALACIVAPLCEEFIFRGLVYQGLRRTHGWAWSMLWTSLFFTAVHPMQSSVAVFALSAVNAWIMERTGRLTPCILVHAGYNAFVLWLQAAG